MMGPREKTCVDRLLDYEKKYEQFYFNKSDKGVICLPFKKLYRSIKKSKHMLLNKNLASEK